MGLKDRDYNKSTGGYFGHPPTCTCKACEEVRLGKKTVSGQSPNRDTKAEPIKRVNQRRYLYYVILGLEFGAEDWLIKRAYLKLMKLYHPDVNKSIEAIQTTIRINRAYSVLSNPQLKRIYDSSLVECLVCGTHEVIKSEQGSYKCTQCGYVFEVSELINATDNRSEQQRLITKKIKTAVEIFSTARCSWCSKFYTNEPFLCPHRELHTACTSFSQLSPQDRDRLFNDDRWWWRMWDRLHQVQDKGILARCKVCGAINPNPGGNAKCWSCGRNSLTCPTCPGPLMMRYNLDTDMLTCPNASHSSYSIPVFLLPRHKEKESKRRKEKNNEGRLLTPGSGLETDASGSCDNTESDTDEKNRSSRVYPSPIGGPAGSDNAAPGSLDNQAINDRIEWLNRSSKAVDSPETKKGSSSGWGCVLMILGLLLLVGLGFGIWYLVSYLNERGKVEPMPVQSEIIEPLEPSNIVTVPSFNIYTDLATGYSFTYPYDWSINTTDRLEGFEVMSVFLSGEMFGIVDNTVNFSILDTKYENIFNESKTLYSNVPFLSQARYNDIEYSRFKTIELNTHSSIYYEIDIYVFNYDSNTTVRISWQRPAKSYIDQELQRYVFILLDSIDN